MPLFKEEILTGLAGSAALRCGCFIAKDYSTRGAAVLGGGSSGWLAGDLRYPIHASIITWLRPGTAALRYGCFIAKDYSTRVVAVLGGGRAGWLAGHGIIPTAQPLSRCCGATSQDAIARTRAGQPGSSGKKPRAVGWGLHPGTGNATGISWLHRLSRPYRPLNFVVRFPSPMGHCH